MLPKESNPTRCHQLMRALHKLTLISVYHPESFKCFLSYPAILAERQKQLFDGGTYVVHPFSVISLIWSSFMIFINIAHIIVSSIRLCLVLEQSPIPDIHTEDFILLTLHLVCLLDVLYQFNVGFQEGHASNIVTRRSRIALHYFCGWFFVDLLSCLPIAFIFLLARLDHRYLLLPHYLPLLRLIKFYKVLRNLRISLHLLTRSYVWHRLVVHLALFCVTIHLCACTIYIAPATCYYVYGKIQAGYCGFLKIPPGGEYHNVPFGDRYKKALFLSFASFFGIGFSTMSATRTDEVFIDALIIFYCCLFMVYTLVIFLKLYLTVYNSTMRYYELISQVKKYMRHKQFPKSLKKRVMSFYHYLYQERYFKEESALECLSEQLRNEINLHTCHKLISKVALFEGIPANVVGAILGCLRPEVFMPLDLVVRGGDVGDCMYFIAAGTVAVYSLKGAEVCHLEDGAHFGEVALLMKDSKRVATVVAIEITQVYRLEEADFREFIMSYHELYERVEALASQRMHETVLIDEAFRKVHRPTLEVSPTPTQSNAFSPPTPSQAAAFSAVIPSQTAGAASSTQIPGYNAASPSQTRMNASSTQINKFPETQHYFCGWFFVDLLSCLPIAFIFLLARLDHRYLLLPHYLPLLRLIKFYKVLRNLRISLHLLTRSYVWHRLVVHLALFCVTIHLCACTIYIAPATCYYVYGKIQAGYCGFLKIPPGGEYHNVPFGDRYKKALFLSFASFFGIGFSTMSATRTDEVFIDALIIFYCCLFMVYTLVIFLKLYLTVYNSTMRYYELISQVKKYMRHKQFPKSLKKRVMSFYHYLYQERYFKEESALECLSEQLRNEINLHTCHKLISKVALFEGIPAKVVGAILGCLRPEVFMPLDLVVRGGDVGDCMYFIAAGTVAVYSLKGAEVCHLEDGAHFGEVALLMKDSKRVATVVAIEITQVYRLEEADFREFIMSYHELYERVEALASQRMHETVLIDEAFRKVHRPTLEVSPTPTQSNAFSPPTPSQAAAFSAVIPSQTAGAASSTQIPGYNAASPSQTRMNASSTQINKFPETQ